MAKFKIKGRRFSYTMYGETCELKALETMPEGLDDQVECEVVKGIFKSRTQQDAEKGEIVEVRARTVLKHLGLVKDKRKANKRKLKATSLKRSALNQTADSAAADASLLALHSIIVESHFSGEPVSDSDALKAMKIFFDSVNGKGE